MSGHHRIEPADQAQPPEPDPSLLSAAVSLIPGANRDAITVVGPDLLKVETTGGGVAFRRWPAGTTKERVTFVHALLARLGETGRDPLVISPFLQLEGEGPDTTASVEDRYVDARAWINGSSFARPLRVVNDDGSTFHLPGTLSLDDVTLIAQAIGVAHEGSHGDRDVKLTGPKASVERFCKASQAIFDQQRQQLRRISPHHPHIQHWLRASEAALPEALKVIREARYLPSSRPPACHLAIWPDHLLNVRRERSTPAIGMVDFANAAISSPLLDLAQAASRLRPWSADTADALISGYTAAAPLTPEERRSLMAVTAITLVVDTGHFLQRAWLGDWVTENAQAAAVRKASAQSVKSLEDLLTVMNRESRSGSRKRVWTRREPPEARPRRGQRPTTKRD